MLKQRTFEVEGRKITIKSRPVTSKGNLMGWNVWVNGWKCFCFVLTREDAEDRVFARWAKANTGQAGIDNREILGA